MLKFVEGSGFNADLNLNVLFKEKIWMGIGLRNVSSLNLLVDINLTDLRNGKVLSKGGFGYSYITSLNNPSRKKIIKIAICSDIESINSLKDL